MSSTYSKQAFEEHIIELSKSDNIWDAIEEWDYISSDRKESNCPCGHDISENCHISNRINGNTTIVGNCCIRKFTTHNGTKKIGRAHV